MREISEYKLLGIYLLTISDRTAINNLKYEQVKYFTQNIMAKISKSGYNIIPINEKNDIIKSMISKGLFKTKIINQKPSFTQIYNYEIAKYIYATYSCDGNLTFKLPKDLKENNSLVKRIKDVYFSNISLDLQLAINSEINNFILKSSKSKMIV